MDYEKFKRAATRDQDVLTTCPYDSAHLVNQSRMQYHLVKCAKQHQQMELKTCPFNATHRINKDNYNSHVQKCPDKRVLESHKFQSQDEVLENNSKFPEYQTPSLPPSDECWDNEDVKTTYEPEKNLTDKCVFRNIQGASKSERRQFRQQERMRVAQINSDTTEIEAPQSDIALRPPKSLPMAMKALELDSRLGMGRGVPHNAFTEKNISEGQVVGRSKRFDSPQLNTVMEHREVRQPVIGRGKGVVSPPRNSLFDQNEIRQPIVGRGQVLGSPPHNSLIDLGEVRRSIVGRGKVVGLSPHNSLFDQNEVCQPVVGRGQVVGSPPHNSLIDLSEVRRSIVGRGQVVGSPPHNSLINLSEVRQSTIGRGKVVGSPPRNSLIYQSEIRQSGSWHCGRGQDILTDDQTKIHNTGMARGRQKITYK